MNLYSTELWSSRDLDQYAIDVEAGRITVHLDRIIEGAPWNVIYLVPDDLTAVAGIVRPERLAHEEILPRQGIVAMPQTRRHD